MEYVKLPSATYRRNAFGEWCEVDYTDREVVVYDEAEALTEIERLRELIRRALADGMGVLDEDRYDLYGELSTYLSVPS